MHQGRKYQPKHPAIHADQHRNQLALYGIRQLHAQPLGQGRHGQQREHEQHQQRKAAAAAERAARLAVRAVRADRVKTTYPAGNQIVPGHGQVLLAMRADWGLKQRHGRQRQGGKCVTMRGRLYRGKPCLRAR